MRIVFAVMPFADAGRPCIGVSLLCAAAQEAGHEARVDYCNLVLAATLGLPLYQKIASAWPPEMLVGEWFFADDVFGDEIPDPQDYLNDVFLPKLGADPQTVSDLLEARAHRDAFLDACVDRIMADGPDVVGFTSTFHQTCPSLAVAKRLKALPDPPVVIFGGANCEGEMGLALIRAMPWIDYICSGESDVSLPRLLNAIETGDDTPVPGVLSRDRMDRAVRSAPVMDMNALPLPDFAGYFEGIETSQLNHPEFEPHLVIETSRGCWWGAKHHCTFCGLNGDTMAFRAKSADRAFDEITTLARTYDVPRFGCVDNILDMSYVRELFPRLAASDISFDIFYEVKANLRYAQLSAMKAGGLTQIQPGIESFSDSVLKLMEKGCTGFQNIQLLRWCEEIGIDAAWNLLAGFPGEDQAEYARMAALLPSLSHLKPPYSCARLRLDRFSPFHSRADAFGFARMRPAQAYFYVFPLGRKELAHLAYYFDFDYDDGRNPDLYVRPVQSAVTAWWEEFNAKDRARLDARYLPDGSIKIEDTRACAPAPARSLTGTAALLLVACDIASKPPALASNLGLAEAAVQDTLDTLVADKLMAEDNGRYLSLPVFRKRPPDLTDDERTAHARLSATKDTGALLDLV